MAKKKSEEVQLLEALKALHVFTKDFVGPKVDKLNKQAEKAIRAAEGEVKRGL